MRLVVVAILALLAAACGSDSASPGAQPVTIALDFTPNPVHAPIYEAAKAPSHGISLRIRKPGSGPDSLKLVASGKVDLGVADIHDLAIARQQGVDVVGVAALVGKPLAALVAQPGISRPRALAGKTVGVSGLPSDPAFLKAIVEHDGGDVSKIRQVTIGFAAVSRLLTKRVDAVPAFWNAEGVALKRSGLDVKEFRVEDYGAPPYPEVVLITSGATLKKHRDRIKGALAAIAGGLDATRRDPGGAVSMIARAAETKDTALVRAQLDAVLPVFAPGLELDRGVLDRWADFDAGIGLVKQRPDVAKSFDFTLR
ncbi:ABC transporter substrate-binding protein [Candidatus Solirubrobacter pratensis]|uniref:ABC transporter substrate-binding protein n=1 Tax=Candidatus Solirubrobacter pratensis TaxID=1298857 RepID=UPI000402EBF4|nr:ABC transporter substrate-binding protein [Candidatus Solirubrobacter pratensis]